MNLPGGMDALPAVVWVGRTGVGFMSPRLESSVRLVRRTELSCVVEVDSQDAVTTGPGPGPDKKSAL